MIHFLITVFIPELYGLTTPTKLDEGTPYEVPVPTLHKPFAYKPQNTHLNVSGIYTVVDDMEMKKREFHEHVNESDNHSDVIKKDLPTQLYFTLDQVSILLSLYSQLLYL